MGVGRLRQDWLHFTPNSMSRYSGKNFLKLRAQQLKQKAGSIDNY
jgi:hypothetical protein